MNEDQAERMRGRIHRLEREGTALREILRRYLNAPRVIDAPTRRALDQSARILLAGYREGE